MSNPADTGRIITCSKCGAQNEGTAFCQNCGSELQSPTVSPGAPFQYVPSTPQAPPPPAQTAPVTTYTAAPVPPVDASAKIKNYDPKWDYSPIKAWGYFGLNLLFAIPLVGLIFLLIFAFGGTKRINIRNYARSFFISLLIAVILGIIIAIFWGALINLLGATSFDYSWSLF